MTVIALRNGVLAADSLICTDRARAGSMVKIVRCATAAGGAAGRSTLVELYLGWIRDGAKKRPSVTKQFNAEGFYGLLIAGGRVRVYERGGFFNLTMAEGFYAIGTGAEGAACAMAAGASAEQAVAAACKIVPSCGAPIDVIDVRDLLPDLGS